MPGVSGIPQDRLGQLERLGKGSRLCFVRELAHPPARVWRALTDPAELSSWFPTSVEGAQRAGAPLVFRHPGGEAPPFEGRMVLFEPPAVLELDWGPDRLRFELEAIPGGTRLTLYAIISEFGRSVRDAAGWHVCLDRLEQALSPGSLDGQGGPVDWRAANAGYVDAFGAEATTIGPPKEFLAGD